MKPAVKSTNYYKYETEESIMKEFLAGLILTLVVGGIGVAIEMNQKEVKYIDINRNSIISCRCSLWNGNYFTHKE